MITTPLNRNNISIKSYKSINLIKSSSASNVYKSNYEIKKIHKITSYKYKTRNKNK